MTFRFVVDLSHASFGKMHKEYLLAGDSLETVVNSFQIPLHCKENLIHHGKAGCTDEKGVKHRWAIKRVEETIPA